MSSHRNRAHPDKYQEFEQKCFEIYRGELSDEEVVRFLRSIREERQLLETFFQELNKIEGYRTYTYELAMREIPLNLIEIYIPDELNLTEKLEEALLDEVKSQKDNQKNINSLLDQIENLRKHKKISISKLESLRGRILTINPLDRKGVRDCKRLEKWCADELEKLRDERQKNNLLKEKKRLAETSYIKEIMDIEEKLCRFRPRNQDLEEMLAKVKEYANTRYEICKFNNRHTEDNGEPLERKEIYPILSIDGGGVRGIIPAIVLTEIEKRTNSRIPDLFRMVGGTSVGGILALGLTKPHDGDPSKPQYSAQNLLTMFTEESNQLFQPNPNFNQLPLSATWGQKIMDSIYNPKYLRPTSFFQQKFRECKLHSALTDIVIVTNTKSSCVRKAINYGLASAYNLFQLFGGSNFTSQDITPKEIHLFTKKGLKTVRYSFDRLKRHYNSFTNHYPMLRSRSESNLSISAPYSWSESNENAYHMSTVAAITSAAPTFFSPFQFGNDDQMFDGGVLQNNPSFLCAFEAIDKGNKAEDVVMLSLGTGIEREASPLELWQPEQEQDDLLHNILHQGLYFRFQPTIDGIKFDDNRPEALIKLTEYGNQVVEDNDDQIRELCKILKPGV